MTSFVIEWNNGKRTERVATAEELDAVLDRIEQERGVDGLPFKVDVTEEGSGDDLFANGLHLGLGHPERTAVEWIGPPFGAAGYEPQVPAWEGEPISFDYGGLPTEEAPDQLRVTPTTARRAAREFVVTRQRPTCLEWQRDA